MRSSLNLRIKFLFCLLFVSLLSVCHEDILSASTEARKQQRLAKRAAVVAERARKDSLLAAGVLGYGFTPGEVVAVYGRPHHKGVHAKLPVEGASHFLDQWVYPNRLKYVYFVDGKVTDIVGMMPAAPSRPEE